MFRRTIRLLPLVALLLGGCGEPELATPSVSASPEETVRLWLDAAKRGDADAMWAIYDEALSSKKKSVIPEHHASMVASTTYRALWWEDLEEEPVKDPEGEHEVRTVTVHVVFRGPDGTEHPDNLMFRLAQRNGKWWIANIADFD